MTGALWKGGIRMALPPSTSVFLTYVDTTLKTSLWKQRPGSHQKYPMDTLILDFQLPELGWGEELSNACLACGSSGINPGILPRCLIEGGS